MLLTMIAAGLGLGGSIGTAIATIAVGGVVTEATAATVGMGTAIGSLTGAGVGALAGLAEMANEEEYDY